MHPQVMEIWSRHQQGPISLWQYINFTVSKKHRISYWIGSFTIEGLHTQRVFWSAQFDPVSTTQSITGERTSDHGNFMKP
jgi:hypothetical protein